MESTQSAGSRSVSRALAILEILARAGRPLPLTEIARELDLPKSSTLGLLRALVRSGFAGTDDHGGYVLGLRSFEVGAAYLRSMTPTRAVDRELRALTSELGVTSHFAVLDGDEVIYVAKHDPSGAGVRLASSLGARLPAATTAVGKAQLACLESSTGTSDALRRELDAVRVDGFAVDDGLTLAGVRCVAAPVFDLAGCCGAIGVSYPALCGLDLDAVTRALVAAARQASERLGAAGRGIGGAAPR